MGSSDRMILCYENSRERVLMLDGDAAPCDQSTRAILLLPLPISYQKGVWRMKMDVQQTKQIVGSSYEVCG